MPHLRNLFEAIIDVLGPAEAAVEAQDIIQIRQNQANKKQPGPTKRKKEKKRWTAG
jgi:hypothetical protein